MDNSKIGQNRPLIKPISSKKLPAGTFGSACRVQYERETVVIKRPHRWKDHPEKDNQATTKFQLEINNHAALSHPNIVNLIYGDTYLFYMTLEWMNQGDLFSFIEKKSEYIPFEHAEITFILQNIGKGLLYLHNNDWLHRDLKPENILINIDQKTGAWQVKIGDFGFIKKLESQKQEYKGGKAVGTASYIALEIVESYIYSKKSDVYSFGLIAAVLLSLTTPFQQYKKDKEIVEAIKRHEDPIIIPENNLYQFTSLIKSCYSYDPEQRPYISSVVEQILEHEQTDSHHAASAEQQRSVEPVMCEVDLDDNNLIELATYATQQHIYNPLAHTMPFFKSKPLNKPSSEEHQESKDNRCCVIS